MKTYLNPNNSLENDLELKKMIDQIGIKKDFPKNSVILREGQVCDFFFYVVRGVFRTFRLIDEKEITIGFSFTGDIDTCPYSYTHNTGSKDIIQSLAHSKVFFVYKHDFNQYLEHNKQFKDRTPALLGSYIEVLIQRQIAQRLKTAEENYLELVNRNPEQVSKIAKSHIASFLGVSPERISRIRKKNRLN